MIKKITLKNYRCFENYSVNFKKECLIADENNAGKSTIIESLRIVSIVSRKLLVSKYYVNAPESMKLAKNFFGLNINVDQYKIDLRTIVYFYDENKNAEIICEFEDNVIYHIYLNTEKVFACIYYKSELIKGIKKAKDIKPSSIEVNIMPHLSLIRENERKISSDTINNDQYTYLSSKHFRNEILLNKKNSFDIFKSVAEELWNGLNIREIYDTGSDEDNICLLIQDNNFASEIGLMGSGLQMYLQIVWFISRHSSDSTVILDEPDVYLHPSLQKKIYNYIKSKYNQVIVATHSIELLSMPDYENVFQIDKNKKLQNYSKSINSVQSIINKMGGSQNISLMRLGRQNKCIFVEGFDKKIINSFLNILYPDKLSILSDLPIIELGGFENYHQALGASKLFYQESGGNFKCICILDKDYRLEKDIDKVQLQADRSHLILHVWQRKELESYLVNLEVIHSFIESKVNYENFCAELNEELDSFYFEIMDQYSNAIHNADKSLSIQTSNQKARDYIKEYWSSLEGKLKIINGKRLLSFVIDFVSKKYKSRITMKKIISRFKVKNVDSEIQQVIDLLIK